MSICSFPAMIGPPINLGSKGISEVIDGTKFRVGVLRAASSANSDSGLLSKSELVLEAACGSAPASLVKLLVEDGGEGSVVVVVTNDVADTIALLGAKVTAVLSGLALFKIFGVAGLSPFEVTAATAAALAGTKWINLVGAVGLTSFWRLEGSTLTLTMPSFLGMAAAETVMPLGTPLVRVEWTILEGSAGLATMLVLSGTMLEMFSRFSLVSDISWRV